VHAAGDEAFKELPPVRLGFGELHAAACAPTTTNLDGPDSLAGGPCSSRFKGGWLWLGR
jgi:hypothetical protein